MTTSLTANVVRQAKPGAVRREVADAALPGLYLVIQPSGVKSWALRYRVAGKSAKLTLGRVVDFRARELATPPEPGEPMTLAEARDAARRALRTLGEGRDPGAEKATRRAASRAPEPQADRDLLRVQADAFIRRYAKPRLRSWAEVERQFKKEVVPVIGMKRVQDVTRRDLVELVDTIVDRGAPMTANRVLATLSRFFGWLVERDVVAASPVVGMKKPTKEVARDRVLDDEELAAIWRAAGVVGYPFGPAVRLLILSGCRRDEVFGARWREIELGNVLQWVLPAARVKNGRDHVVAITPEIRAVLDELPRIGPDDFAFTTTGRSPASGYARAKDRLDAAIAATRGDAGPLKAWTFHDLRRTAASGMARLGIAPHVVEAVLNHKTGAFAGVAGVYNRHDYAAEKRAALEAWSRHVLGLAGEASPAAVVPFRRGRK